jgi:N-acetylmuramoyl-L-alanine amidase
MYRFLLRLLVIALSMGGILNAAWEERQIHGRGYVSAESIKSFYAFDSLVRDGKAIVMQNKRVRLQLQSGSHECLMNGVKFVFSYPVEVSGGKTWVSKIDLIKLVDPVLRPSFIDTAGNFRTVIIDPGHGGKDPGATNSIGTEAGYNLKVANYLKEILEKEYKYQVIMTRSSDRFLSLQQRVDLANGIRENAIFVSIHHNSGQRNARGIETFTLSPVGVSHYGSGLKASDFREKTGNHQDSANVALATAVHGSILSMLKDKKTGKAYTLDRGIKRARFSVLTGVKHPSILVECGFMTHQYEARLIHDQGYQRTLAKAIGFAIQKYRFAVSQPKAPQPAPRGSRQQ